MTPLFKKNKKQQGIPAVFVTKYHLNDTKPKCYYSVRYFHEYPDIERSNLRHVRLVAGIDNALMFYLVVFMRRYKNGFKFLDTDKIEHFFIFSSYLPGFYYFPVHI